jgi:predicted nucleic acid-binding protein
VIRYLIDSSALWRIQRDKLLREAWAEVISNSAVGSCQPQRTEFKSSARNHMEYESMSDMFAELYTDVAVPKSAWQWVEATQYRLARNGGHQGLSVVDLLISATAAHHGLIVLHDDNDFATVARNVQDLRERNVNATP